MSEEVRHVGGSEAGRRQRDCTGEEKQKERIMCVAELCLTLVGRETGMMKRDRPEGQRQAWSLEPGQRQRDRPGHRDKPGAETQT
jgi:hypothetical protein